MAARSRQDQRFHRSGATSLSRNPPREDETSSRTNVASAMRFVQVENKTRVLLPGSTGCQPVLFGSLPKTSSIMRPGVLATLGKRRQVADDNPESFRGAPRRTTFARVREFDYSLAWLISLRNSRSPIASSRRVCWLGPENSRRTS